MQSDASLAPLLLPCLGVDLARLRRPRGSDGDRDVARYRELTPALRAATILEVLASEAANGGIDQFVWNQFSILAATIEALLHIEAHGPAGLLARLGVQLLEQTDDPDGDVVANFMAFRARTELENTFEGGIILEVTDALTRFALLRPEEFVLEPVEVSEWQVGDERFRTAILRRPDDHFEVAVYKGVYLADDESSAGDLQWHELARDAVLLADHAAARAHAADERNQRSTEPDELIFIVSEWSDSGSHWPGARLWARGDLAVDSLPNRAPLLVVLQGEHRQVEATGRFVADRWEPRYGHVWLDDDPPPGAERCRGWLATCRVRSD